MNIREVILQFSSRFDARGMAAMALHMRRAKTEAERFEDNLRKISAAFVSFGTASVLAFKQYEKSLTEFAGKAMNTVDEFSNKFHNFSGQISRDTGMIRREVLRGLQEGTSALLDPVDSKNLSKKAAILAAGNQSLMNQAVGVALSGYRNKFGKPAKILDYAYSTAQLGQGQVAEFAPALQYVFGFARGAGLELKEVAAGIAAISATAPSPIMGATQFGAFLTGIARGSTYEDKLKEGTGGKSSQDMRDMLREEGLAKTVEFLASKFSGDELQQVYGRKELVQFVQGTTGRRGIVKQLERLITENAETGPIERFGDDLTKTLANKWDQFIRTVEQLGVEFGTPLATLAKGILTISKKIAEFFLWINDKTGGVFAILTTALGGMIFAFTIIPKIWQMAIFAFLRPLTGFTHFFRDRYGPMAGNAFGGEAAAAAAGYGAGAAGARAGVSGAQFDAGVAAGVAAEAAFVAGSAAAGAAGSAKSSHHTDPNWTWGRADKSGGENKAAWDAGYRKAKKKPRFYVSPDGSVFEEGIGSPSGRDKRRGPGLRAEHQEYVNAKSRATHEYKRAKTAAATAAMEKEYLDQVREMNRVTNDLIKNGNFKPHLRNSVMHALMTDPTLTDFNRGRIIPRPSSLSDDTIGRQTGWFPFNKNITQFGPEAYNPDFHDPMNTGNWKGFVDWDTYDPSRVDPMKTGDWESFVDWDQYLKAEHKGKGFMPGDITPDMIYKNKQREYGILSAAPWLAAEFFLHQFQGQRAEFVDPFSKMRGVPPSGATDNRAFWNERKKTRFYSTPEGIFDAETGKPKTSRIGMAPPGYADYSYTFEGGDTPVGRRKASERGRVSPNQRARPKYGQGWRGWGDWALYGAATGVDWIRGSGDRIKGFHENLGDPRNPRRAFGGGAWGRGLQMGMKDRRKGESIFENIDAAFESIASFNAERTAKGQKTMNANVAKSAFFLGKIWKGVLLNPAVITTAIASGTWFAASKIWQGTDYGKAMNRLINDRENSPYNPENISEYNTDLGMDMVEYNKKLREELFPEPEEPVHEINSFYDNFVNMFRNIGKWWTKRRDRQQQQQDVYDMIAEIEAGNLPPEVLERNKMTMQAMGVIGYEFRHKKIDENLDPVKRKQILQKLRLKPGNLWDKPELRMLPRIHWAEDRDQKFRIHAMKVSKSMAEETGLMPLAGGDTGISDMLTNIFSQNIHLMQDGQKVWAAQERNRYLRMFAERADSTAVQYFTLDMPIYIETPNGYVMASEIHEQFKVNMDGEADHLTRELSSDVVR